MRSTIGAKGRMAGHLAALFLLIVFMAYAEPRASAPVAPAPPPVAVPAPTERTGIVPAEAAAVMPDPSATLAEVVTPVTAEHVPAERLRPPGSRGAPTPAGSAARPSIEGAGPPPSETLADHAADALQPSAAPLRPPPADADPGPEPADSGADAADAAGKEPDALAGNASGDAAPVPQPDESGSLVVASAETGAEGPVAATAPLANANLEVLGDNVYWLDQQHDLAKELDILPEVGTLIVLAPIPGRTIQGFEHIKTAVIPADLDDLSRDAAERYVYMTSDASLPVVTAVLPGVRGAAFFKAAYLLAHRNMPMEDLERELAHELDEAGTARDDVMHRIERLKD